MSLTEITAGDFRVRGRSLGGFYTGLHVPELRSLMDVGTALRTGAAAPNLFLSHAHADHLGALPALLGMRALTGVTSPLRVYLPSELVAPLEEMLAVFSTMHRWPMVVEFVPMEPGDVQSMHGNLCVRAIRTFHPVPSLGYVFFRKIKKLKPEFLSLPGPEIGIRRKRGDDIFTTHESREFAYVTDTLPDILDHHPELMTVDTLVMECTFLDEKKSVKDARAGCHIHLDELLPYIPKFQNKAVVLMHFSQIYSPRDIEAIFTARCPGEYRDRFHLFVPIGDVWWD